MGTDILAGMSRGKFVASSRGSLPVGSMPGSNIYMTERNATVVDQMRYLDKSKLVSWWRRELDNSACWRLRPRKYASCIQHDSL